MARFNQEEEFGWISISDIMSGLMMVFMFIAVLYMINFERKQEDLEKVFEKTGMDADSLIAYIPRVQGVLGTLQNRQDSISKIVAEYRNNRSALYEHMMEVMGQDLSRWGAKVDPQTLTVRFYASQSKFEPGVDELSPGFKRILREFFPKFLKVVMNPDFTEDILEIKIEGHAFQSGEPYETIFAGSQNRARNVLLFLRSLPAYQQLDPKLKRVLDFRMTATGMGFNRMIDGSGNYVFQSGKGVCADCSRRVEFTILTASEKVVYQIEKNM